MRKLLFPLTMVIAMFFVACDMAPTTEEAIDFNDEIVADQSDLIDYNQDFIDEYSGDDLDEIEDAMDELNTFLEDKTEEYEAMEAFDEEDIFRKAFLDLLGAFTEISEDYEKLLEMWADDDVTLDEIADFEEEINEATDDANQTFLDKQKDFAEQYEFTLADD
jgi:Ni,Fe-hydrogenase I large subunit